MPEPMHSPRDSCSFEDIDAPEVAHNVIFWVPFVLQKFEQWTVPYIYYPTTATFAITHRNRLIFDVDVLPFQCYNFASPKASIQPETKHDAIVWALARLQ